MDKTTTFIVILSFESSPANFDKRLALNFTKTETKEAETLVLIYLISILTQSDYNYFSPSLPYLVDQI